MNNPETQEQVILDEKQKPGNIIEEQKVEVEQKQSDTNLDNKVEQDSHNNREIKKVLVTGGNGYLGSWIVFYLLDLGYQVKASVRSIKNKESYKHLEKFPNANSNLEIVEAKLEVKEHWTDAVKGVQAIIHCAFLNSYFTQEKHSLETIYPCVEGTLAILHEAVEQNVNKIVITGSLASVRGSKYSKVYNEEDIAEINEKLSHIDEAKILQERCAQYFVRDKGKSINLKVQVLIPGMQLGPTHQEECKSSSCRFFKSLMNGEMHIIKVQELVCDVRDAAIAHINTMKNKSSYHPRLIIGNETVWISEIYEKLEEKYSKYGYKFPKKNVSNFFLKFSSWFDSSLKPIIPFQGKEVFYMKERAKLDRILIDYRSLEQTLIDMAECFIEKGWIEDKTKEFEKGKHKIDNVKKVNKQEKKIIKVDLDTVYEESPSKLNNE